MADRIGQQLDTYRLVRLLGAGGFGEVYLAEHLYRTTQVAIKLLPPLAQDDLHSFLIEARTFRLKHPNIVQVLDFGVEGRTPFIVMEYAPNGTLRQRHPKGRQVPLPTIVTYVKQVASALQYAHDERLVHRDVKPENMLIGVENQVLLSDFGIATIAHGTASQSVETMAGTIPYMAPEQIQGHPRPASDQYSLGVVVYEWLCGDRPFQGTLAEVVVQQATTPPPPLREKVPTISPEVEQVVMNALAKDSKQRFGSVLAFATAFEQACQVNQPEAEPEPVIPVSETTETNQSQQPTAMATPVPGILLSQQTLGEVPANLPAQPQTLIPSPGEERLPQAEEEGPLVQGEGARQAREQADTLEEERDRQTKETAVAATALATTAHQPLLPTEVNRSPRPPALRPEAVVAVKPVKPSASRRFVRLGLAGLVIVALVSGIAWFTLHRASPAGSITEFPLPIYGSRPYSITAGPSGNLWFTEFLGNKIGRISSNGVFREFPLPPGSGPDGITAGPDGNLWFTDESGNKIGRITTGGSITEFPLPIYGSYPTGITAGPGGNLWFAEHTGNQIGRITTGGSITEFALPTDCRDPTYGGCLPDGIIAGPDGNLWFTEYIGGQIGRISPNGVFREFPLPPGSGPPRWITAGPDGNLWFTDGSGNKIGRITTGGSITEYPIPTAKSYPWGITAGPDGNLWFAEYDGNKIGRITSGK